MNKREFIQEFHTLWNNINSDMAPGLTFSEISHFATHAQEVLVRSIYNGALGDSFESTEEARSYLDNLVRQCSLTDISSIDGEKISSSSKSYWLTDNPTTGFSSIKPTTSSHIMYIVYESVRFGSNASGCYKNREVLVKPVSHDMYWNIKDNPFKGAGKDRVLRLTKSMVKSYADGDYTFDIAEIVSKEQNISEYMVRYIKRPYDIVFTQANTSAGADEPLCELHENLHRLILNSSVEMAKTLWDN